MSSSLLLYVIAALLAGVLVLLGFVLSLQLSSARRGAEEEGDADAVFSAIEASRREILQQIALQTNGMAHSTQNLMNFVVESQKHANGSVLEWTRTSDAALAGMRETLNREFRELQSMMETRLERVRGENERKLEQIRETVQEKLDATLTERLQTSFRTVDAKLALVQQGLGEMRAMAENVRRLQNVLTNVKTRGLFGETQFEAIVSEILTPAQYAKQVRVIPGKNVAVDFAVKLPGRDGQEPVWLPIDSKFPVEPWERLQAATDAGDANGAAAARKELERAILKQAESIREKYVEPPYTTDFAVMFLPSEGLYAEVLRTPGLVERLQREYRVTPTGPTVAAALLNSLLMGFMTLVMEKRSGEVWTLLANVKTEFELFTTQFALVEKKFREAQNSLSQMGTRSRQMEKCMSAIDELVAVDQPAKPRDALETIDALNALNGPNVPLGRAFEGAVAPAASSASGASSVSSAPTSSDPSASFVGEFSSASLGKDR